MATLKRTPTGEPQSCDKKSAISLTSILSYHKLPVYGGHQATRVADGVQVQVLVLVPVVRKSQNRFFQLF